MQGGGGSRTVTSTSDIPANYRQFADETLSLVGTATNMPYQQYQGQRIADFSPLQQQYFDQVAAGINAGTGADFMDAYTNPYEEDVIGDLRLENERALASGLNTLGSRAGAGGNFGSRLGVSEGVTTSRAVDDLTGQVGNFLSDNFYRSAMLGQQDANRDYAAQQQQLNNLLMAGGMQQGLDQANLDLAQGDFYDQQNDIWRKIAARQSALGQTTMGSIQRQPVYTNSGIGGLISGAGSLLGGIGALGGLCWVAREVYGEENPKWGEFRTWLIWEAPHWLYRLYSKHGERFAGWIKDKPRLKRVIRSLMDKVT